MLALLNERHDLELVEVPVSADDIAAGPEGVLAAIGRCAAGEPCSWLEQNIVTRFLWPCFPDRHAHRVLAMCLLKQREFTASRRERDRSAAARFLHQCLLRLAWPARCSRFGSWRY